MDSEAKSEVPKRVLLKSGDHCPSCRWVPPPLAGAEWQENK